MIEKEKATKKYNLIKPVNKYIFQLHKQNDKNTNVNKEEKNFYNYKNHRNDLVRDKTSSSNLFKSDFVVPSGRVMNTSRDIDHSNYNKLHDSCIDAI